MPILIRLFVLCFDHFCLHRFIRFTSQFISCSVRAFPLPPLSGSRRQVSMSRKISRRYVLDAAVCVVVQSV